MKFYKLSEVSEMISMICSKCGHVKEDLTLQDRTYVCSHCGSVIDRDLNASINLKNFGIHQLAAV